LATPVIVEHRTELHDVLFVGACH